ncbi:hypothetical protein Tco_0703844 [Tanacetum coccineum]|uniref:Uncharacterized protein n=1 Tax=Tanacetum coccineum TaxID=301880 RepID=A0ABQ4Y1J4_9ASTR
MNGQLVTGRDENIREWGNLLGKFQVGNTIHYQDYKWYEALEDSDLKDEALRNKAALEESMNQDEEPTDDAWRNHSPIDEWCDQITVLKTNTPYPSRKIRRIRACTHQRPQRNKDQYAVSRENQYAVFKIWNQYNILEDIKRGPYSKTLISQYAYPTQDTPKNDKGYQGEFEKIKDVKVEDVSRPLTSTLKFQHEDSLLSQNWMIDYSPMTGNDEVELTDEESSDDEDDIAEVFRIDTNNMRYMMIKYSFNDDEEYVVVKEDEYDDLTVTRKEACRAYQEIFQIMDEGWMVTRAE